MQFQHTMIQFECGEIEPVFLNRLYMPRGCYGFIEGTRPFGMEFDKKRINWNVLFHLKAACNENGPFPISECVSDDNFNSDGKRQLYLFLFIQRK